MTSDIPSALVGDVTLDGVSVVTNHVAALPAYPTVPTTVSSFTNDAGYITSSDVSNMVTTNTAQTITGIKTFQANSYNPIVLKQHANSTRVGVSLQNSGGGEYGFFQYNGTTGYTVFGVSYVGNANNKLAFRYYGQTSNNRYNVIMPGTEKYTDIGAGDLNLPLAVKIGSSGTPITASAGGLITLPSETWTFTLSDNTTVTKTVVLG